MRTEKITALDGTPPQRFILIAFDSVDTAKAWRASPAMKEIWAIEEKTSKSRIFFVEGTRSVIARRGLIDRSAAAAVLSVGLIAGWFRSDSHAQGSIHHELSKR